MTAKIKLTLERAKEICPDFQLKDGKCRHLQADKETCLLPRHFLCELVLYKRSIERRAEIQGSALSASRLFVIERCARRYALHYEHGVSEESQPWQRMGDAFGVARARFDTGLEVDDTMLRQDLLPVERAKVCAAIRFYRNAIGLTLDLGEPFPYAPGSVTCELEVLFQHESTWFLGFADAVSADRKNIYEWKFAVGNYPMISIARQAAVYFRGVPEAERFTLCRFRKPVHRPRKNEPPEKFQHRLYSIMASDPEEWMTFTSIDRSAIDVDGVLSEMVASSKRINELSLLGYPPSYSACDDCPFEGICSKYIGKTTAEISAALRDHT